jgi:membrane protease YdiL (CAAX protease family)
VLNKTDLEKGSRYNWSEKWLLIVFLIIYALIFAPPKVLTVFTAGQPLLLTQAVAYGVLGIGSVFLFRRDLIAGIKSWKSSALKNILWLVGAFVASTFIDGIAAYPAYSMGYEDISNSEGTLLLLQTIGRPFTILVVGLFGPIVEECVYRAFLIGKMKSKFPLWVCVILSSLLFACVHLHGFSLLDFLSVLPAFTSGLIYGIAYAATGNITVPLCMHILNNMVGIMFYGG